MEKFYSSKLKEWRDFLLSEHSITVAYNDQLEFSNFIDELSEVLDLAHSYIEKTDNANEILRILNNGINTPFKIYKMR